MPDPKQISEAEARVMEILWRESPLSAQHVIARLSGTKWSAQTIKTLLGRLLKKGALGYRQPGRHYLYSPLITRAEYTESQSSHLLERLFGGQVTALVASFAEQGALQPSDLVELRALVEKLDEGDGNR